MIDILGMKVEHIDIIALAWFLILWSGYSMFADYKKESNLVKSMHKHRIQWMKSMVLREDRLVDIRIIESLLHTTTFLASTSILIIAGLVAVLGFGKEAVAIIDSLSITIDTSLHMWIVKTMLLLIIFIYSFFKFTWVIRQFNYSLVLIVAAPCYKKGDKEVENPDKGGKYIDKIATMISNAGRHFNMGIRSYYLGLVALSWFITPILFMVLSVLVIMVLYRREFMSKTLMLLE